MTKLEDIMELINYDVFVMLQDAVTGEWVAITYALTIKSDKRFDTYMSMPVFQIVPVNDGTLKITLTH